MADVKNNSNTSQWVDWANENGSQSIASTADGEGHDQFTSVNKRLKLFLGTQKLVVWKLNLLFIFTALAFVIVSGFNSFWVRLQPDYGFSLRSLNLMWSSYQCFSRFYSFLSKNAFDQLAETNQAFISKNNYSLAFSDTYRNMTFQAAIHAATIYQEGYKNFTGPESNTTWKEVLFEYKWQLREPMKMNLTIANALRTYVSHLTDDFAQLGVQGLNASRQLVLNATLNGIKNMKNYGDATTKYDSTYGIDYDLAYDAFTNVQLQTFLVM